MGGNPIKMGHAFVLVASGLRNRSGGTTLNARSARSLGKEEAVLRVALVWPSGRGDSDAGDHGATAHGLPQRGDQAAAETESPKPRSVSGMPLRPVRCIAVLLRNVNAEGREEGRAIASNPSARRAPTTCCRSLTLTASPNLAALAHRSDGMDFSSLLSRFACSV